MSNVDVIARSIDFIEKNLKKKITLKEISDFCGYSQYYFIKLFNGVTGFTPMEYLLKRRLSQIAMALISSQEKNIHIAFDYGFENYESFSRVFKQKMGYSPYRLKRDIKLSNLPILKRIEKKEIENYIKIKEYEPIVVNLDAFAVTGLSTLVKEDTSIITDLWTQFCGQVEHIENRILPEKYYQVSFWSNFNYKEFYIMAGVEISGEFLDNPLFVNKKIPKSDYLKFTHKGYCQDVYLTYNYIYGSYLPRSSYRLALNYGLEYYDENFSKPDNEDSTTHIFIPVC